jgi:hypothetical protein
MTWHEVMKAYENAVSKEGLIFTTVVICVCVSLAIFASFLIESFGTAIIYLFVTAFLIALTLGYHDEKEKENRQEWVEQYAIPYIEHLPDKKIIVDNYSITNKNNKVSFFTKKGDFETITLHGKNEVGALVSMRINARIQPKEHIQKPYLVYKELKKNMPYKFKKGYYNAILFIPKNNH